MNLNCDWKFTRENDRRAWQKRYDDTNWRDVTLPHDWSVEEAFDINNSSGTGYLPAGIGWYRKHFYLPQNAENKRIYITFDGIYNNSQVWCNGYYLGKRPYGYSTFTYDITDFACFGETENVISVFVNHEYVADSRWFTGSGIYRKITLKIKEQISIDNDGLFVNLPKAEHSITNHTDIDSEITLINKIYDGDIIVAENISKHFIEAHSTIKITNNITIDNPKLWSPSEPHLYKFTAQIGNDVEEVMTGICTFEFTPDKGFFLNGVNMKLKGVCVHHDAGCLGSAVVKKVWQRRLEKLKVMGCNAIRMSHNPHMPELYDLCDEMGFLVIDEAFDEWEGIKNKWACGHNVYPPSQYGYSEDFPAWHEADLSAMILRDRNHPSIILWSIGNEIDYPNDPYVYPGLKRLVGNNDGDKPEYEQVYDPTRPDAKRLAVVAKRLMAIIKKHDTSRPITSALAFPELSNLSGFADVLEVVGYNYKEQFYKEDHERYPDRIMLGTENGHHLNAWLDVVNNDYIAGQFLWTGIDFLGETRGWPCHGSQAGILDVAGFEKPSYYYRQSLWSNKPMVHIVVGNSKGWNCKNGEVVEVNVFTNCESVELFLNDKSLGVSETFKWIVPFEKGELKAVGKGCVHSLITYGAAVELKLTARENVINADSQDITHVEVDVVDCDGMLSANASPNIKITVEGEGTIIGIENGNLFDNTPYSSRERCAYNGKLLVYIRSTKTAGAITVKASSHGLFEGSVVINSI